MRAVDEGDEENFPLKYLQQRQGRLIGGFRFEYEYEIEYENDFSIPDFRLQIVTSHTQLM